MSAVAKNIAVEEAVVSEMTLRKFAVWWLRNKPFKVPATDGIRYYEDVSGITLFREGQFQVQMFIVKPNCASPRHAHPHIDSIEYGLYGDDTFDSDRNFRLHGLICIGPGEFHTAAARERGGAFISIQKWQDGHTPTSVELDWVGASLDSSHAAQIGEQSANDVMVLHWPRLRHLIIAALPYLGGTHDEESLLEEIRSARMVFWPGEKSFIITAIEAFPKLKRLNILLANGDPTEAENLVEVASVWARNHGVTKVISSLRPALDRFNQLRPTQRITTGWARVSAVYEKAL